jgi:hypothetical protein
MMPDLWMSWRSQRKMLAIGALEEGASLGRLAL